MGLMFILGTVIISAAMMYSVNKRHEIESGNEYGEGARYRTDIPAYLLIFIFLMLIICDIVMNSLALGTSFTVSFCLPLFLHIAIYYIILLPFLPLLRKHIYSRTVALLWVLPNFLYVFYLNLGNEIKPAVTVAIPGNMIFIIVAVWLAGFAAVMIYNILQHINFRRYILAGAEPVKDEETLKIWKQALDYAWIEKPKFSLVRSSNVSSPLSIGLFDSTTKVVLPQKNYTADELAMIFKHEIIHVARKDSVTKFFLMFCTAMCWFNPFMWVAMRKSAEDLELSCDETVLLNADELTRKQYAGLVLSAAGDGRGFTTCLSASAKSMLYRLQNIAKPAKKSSGALFIGIVFFALSMTSGKVDFAFNEKTGADYIYTVGSYDKYSIAYVNLYYDDYTSGYEIVDEAAFLKYISELEMAHVTSRYNYPSDDCIMYFRIHAPYHRVTLDFYGDYIKVFSTKDGKHRNYTYYCPNGIDYDYLNTIIKPYPGLKIKINTTDDFYVNDFQADIINLTKTTDGINDTVFCANEPYSYGSGLYGYDNIKSVALDFSRQPVGSVKIVVENRDKTVVRTIEKLHRPFEFETLPAAAHYRIYADFKADNNEIYSAEFIFTIGSVDFSHNDEPATE